MADFIGGIIAAPFYCIGWIIIGLIAGALARRVMGSTSSGIGTDIILGLIGAFIGGIVLGLLGFQNGRVIEPGLGIGSIVTALIGAVIVIAIGRALSGRRV
ncbi:MAG: GlsB/YeaQ/YmgE family stress response membrane protein [Chloroflexota bacterium]